MGIVRSPVRDTHPLGIIDQSMLNHPASVPDFIFLPDNEFGMTCQGYLLSSGLNMTTEIAIEDP